LPDYYRARNRVIRFLSHEVVEGEKGINSLFYIQSGSGEANRKRKTGPAGVDAGGFMVN
jgi:hypothetical protein